MDPSTHFFWYGFGQGIIQGFTGAPQYLSAWFHDSWDYITNQYYIVRHIKTTEYVTSNLEDKTAAGVEGEIHQTQKASTHTSISQSDPLVTTNTELEIDKEIDKEKQSENEGALVPDKELEKLSGYEKVLYDTVLIPSGTTEIERDNYIMTSYVNDVNQENTQVLMEYDVNDEVASVYDYGVQRNSYTNLRADASQTQYYVYDGQGSVSALTSVRGNPVVSYQYDAYGEAKVSGETYSPYQYNAEAVDTNTGLQYLRARYYNSSTGGFITQDTYVGTLADPLTQNLYTYTGNNPINFIDPSGHSFLENVWNGVKDVGKAIVNGVKDVGNAIVNGVKEVGKAIVNGAKAIVNGTKAIVNGAKDVVTNAYDKLTGNSSKGGNSSKTSGSSTTSGGNSNTVTTSAFNSYFANQVEAPKPVDQVTASLQSRFGADADVKIVSPNLAYVNGKLVTAMTDNELKMCTSGNNINTNTKSKTEGLPNTVQQIVTFLGGFSDSVLSNLFPGNLKNEPYNERFKVSYNNGAIAGDIVSIVAGLITTAIGAGNVITGLGGLAIGTAGIASGVAAPAGILIDGASAGILVTGVAEVGGGLSITISASKNLGDDIRKAQEAKKKKGEEGGSGTNKVTGRVGSLKTKGEPNSVTELYDEQGNILQKRYYDSNGRVYKDIDYSHGNGDGSHTFPHEHIWDWTQKIPRQ